MCFLCILPIHWWLGCLDLFTYVLTEELRAKWLNQYSDVLNDCSFARTLTCCGWRVLTKLGRSVAHGSTSKTATSNSTLFCKIILFPKYLQFIINIWQYFILYASGSIVHLFHCLLKLCLFSPGLLENKHVSQQLPTFVLFISVFWDLEWLLF